MQAKNITPLRLRCLFGACPSIHKTERSTYLLVGRKVASDALPPGAVGPHEAVIEVPQELLDTCRHLSADQQF
jgi:hypothetical protein